MFVLENWSIVCDGDLLILFFDLLRFFMLVAIGTIRLKLLLENKQRFFLSNYPLNYMPLICLDPEMPIEIALSDNCSGTPSRTPAPSLAKKKFHGVELHRFIFLFRFLN